MQARLRDSGGVGSAFSDAARWKNLKMRICENAEPTPSQREAAKRRILDAVSGWLESRIDEVFEMADEDQEPKIGPRIIWRDLTEVRWQICVCGGCDLEHDAPASLGQAHRVVLISGCTSIDRLPLRLLYQRVPSLR